MSFSLKMHLRNNLIPKETYVSPANVINQYGFIPHNTGLLHLNFQSLEFVSRYRDPQIQETENYGICKF